MLDYDCSDTVVCCGGGICLFQAEDGIRDLVRARGLGDVYKRQVLSDRRVGGLARADRLMCADPGLEVLDHAVQGLCLLYTSDAADERSSVDLGGRRILKKKKTKNNKNKQSR